MVTIERFVAAPRKRQIWAIVDVLGGTLAMVLALYLWSLPRTVPLITVGLLIVVCSIGHELYRQVWGTVGMVVASAILGATVLVFLGTGRLSWRKTHLVGPAACLVGAVVLWRDRVTDSERYIVAGQVRRHIARLEQLLRQIPDTPFHAVLGRGFAAQVEQLADWLSRVYDDGAKDFSVTALYVEMNRFDINTDQWILNGFAFKMAPPELAEDLEFNLGEYESCYEPEFVLKGMEDLQAAFAQTDIGALMVSQVPEDKRRLEAVAIATDLVTARMQELVAAAHLETARRPHPVGRVRVYANAHDTLWLPLCSSSRVTGAG